MANQPYANGVVTVGSTPTLIASPGLPGGIYLTNTGAVTVTLGGSGVTATTGPTLAAGASILLPTAGPAHDLYGITASSTTVTYTFPAGN
jgi:hypothetical protein